VGLGVLGALSFAACSSKPAPASGHRSPKAGPSATDDSIALLPNGHSDREVVLSNVFVPKKGKPGAVISIHPTSSPIRVRVPKLPNGGSLLVCPVDVPAPGSLRWVRTAQACTAVSTTTATPVSLLEADGNTHVAVELDGTWTRHVTVGEVDASYEAVDDHFYVEFVAH
jgi:hypothetical protein